MAESFGVEGRGSFYDGVGCLRDVVQNHLLQMVCLLAMEPPIAATADALRDETVKVMKTIRPLRQSRARARPVRRLPRRAGRGAGLRHRDLLRAARARRLLALGRRAVLDPGRQGARRHGAGGGRRVAAAAAAAVRRPRAHARSPTSCASASSPTTRSRSRCRPSSRASRLVSGRVDLDVAYEAALGGEGPEAYQRLLGDALAGDQRLFARQDAGRGRLARRRPRAATSTRRRSRTSAAPGDRRRPPACCPASATGARRARPAGVDS